MEHDTRMSNALSVFCWWFCCCCKNFSRRTVVNLMLTKQRLFTYLHKCAFENNKSNNNHHTLLIIYNSRGTQPLFVPPDHSSSLWRSIKNEYTHTHTHSHHTRWAKRNQMHFAYVANAIGQCHCAMHHVERSKWSLVDGYLIYFAQYLSTINNR